MSIDKEGMRVIIETQTTLAHLVMNYYLELKKVGMSEENAIKLTQSYQHDIVRTGQDNE